MSTKKNKDMVMKIRKHQQRPKGGRIRREITGVAGSRTSSKTIKINKGAATERHSVPVRKYGRGSIAVRKDKTRGGTPTNILFIKITKVQ